jgi:tryptophan halogenase
MDIVIVGGGTAGWLAAYSIANSQPNKHNITLIESSHIGIIGAGEGSTGQMLRLLTGGVGGFVPKPIDLEDFIEKTDAVNKMVIRFNGWSKPGRNYVVPVLTSLTDHLSNDYIFKYVISKFGSDKVHLASKNGIEYEVKKYDEFISLHFDAHKVGKYFKEMCDGDVKTIDAKIKDSVLDERGYVKSVILEDGIEITGDFFIDCSGFQKVLVNKLDIGWISCKEYLPVNTAMPFIVQYKENEEIIPETGTTAMSSGWMWDIPLQTRRGCGYVFDSNFISQEDAKKEVEKHLGQEIEPIRFINFDSGYADTFWKNNVISLGLASSFFEPLQATSIHNTIIQIFEFVNKFLSDNIEQTITYKNMNSYNTYIKSVMNSSLNLISLNYQGGRTDSEFWKHIHFDNVVTDKVKSLIEMYKTHFPNSSVIEQPDGGHNFGLIQSNMAGLGLASEQLAHKDLVDSNMYDFAEKEYEKYYKVFSYKKKM